MEREVEILSIICFAVTGLSHVLQPKSWIQFFKFLIAKHYTGSFINGLITLPIGALIVSFHNVWTGTAMLLTILGWAYILKSIICFCLPSLGLRSMRRVEKMSLLQFQFSGGILLAVAIALTISIK